MARARFQVIHNFFSSPVAVELSRQRLVANASIGEQAAHTAFFERHHPRMFTTDGRFAWQSDWANRMNICSDAAESHEVILWRLPFRRLQNGVRRWQRRQHAKLYRTYHHARRAAPELGSNAYGSGPGKAELTTRKTATSFMGNDGVWHWRVGFFRFDESIPTRRLDTLLFHAALEINVKRRR